MFLLKDEVSMRIPTLILPVHLYFAHKTPALRYMYLYRKKIMENCLVLFSPLLYSLCVWCLYKFIMK